MRSLVLLVSLVVVGCGLDRREAVCHGSAMCPGAGDPCGTWIPVCAEPTLVCDPRPSWAGIEERPSCEGVAIEAAPRCDNGGEGHCVLIPTTGPGCPDVCE